MEERKNEINTCLQKTNWTTDLKLHKNNVNLATELLLKKLKQS